MLNLELLICCTSPSGARPPRMKAWLDPQPELGLDSEYELCLETVSEDARRALVELDPASPYFLYRVGLVADPGTVWHLSIQDLQSGRLLYEDSDLLALPKEYLIGSCGVTGVH